MKIKPQDTSIDSSDWEKLLNLAISNVGLSLYTQKQKSSYNASENKNW